MECNSVVNARALMCQPEREACLQLGAALSAVSDDPCLTEPCVQRFEPPERTCAVDAGSSRNLAAFVVGRMTLGAVEGATHKELLILMGWPHLMISSRAAVSLSIWIPTRWIMPSLMLSVWILVIVPAV